MRSHPPHRLQTTLKGVQKEDGEKAETYIARCQGLAANLANELHAAASNETSGLMGGLIKLEIVAGNPDPYGKIVDRSDITKQVQGKSALRSVFLFLLNGRSTLVHAGSMLLLSAIAVVPAAVCAFVLEEVLPVLIKRAKGGGPDSSKAAEGLACITASACVASMPPMDSTLVRIHSLWDETKNEKAVEARLILANCLVAYLLRLKTDGVITVRHKAALVKMLPEMLFDSNAEKDKVVLKNLNSKSVFSKLVFSPSKGETIKKTGQMFSPDELALLNCAAPRVTVCNNRPTTMPGVRVAAQEALGLVRELSRDVADAVYEACTFNATDLVLENNVRRILKMAPKSDAKAQAKMRAASSPWRKDTSSWAARRATAQP